MNATSNRLLRPEDLPSDLWDGEHRECESSEPGLVVIANALAAAYSRIVDQYGLHSLATSRDPKNPPVGGLSKEQTDTHFAQAFDGSCARVQLALMDPLNRATKASNNLVRALSGNSLVLADAPCGAGAAVFSLLSTIAHLRAAGVLPRIPLDVHIIGGELAEPARAYAIAVANELRANFEDQAIALTCEFHSWDVTDEISNANLIARMNVASEGRSRRLLVIANFNSFLVKDGKRKVAAPQLKQLMLHSSGEESYAVWIEPNMNAATAGGGLFNWIRKMLQDWSRFAREENDDPSMTEVPVYSSRFKLPLDSTQTARLGLSLITLNLKRH